MMVRRLALIGDKGMLARKVRELAPACYDVHGFDLPEFDLTDGDQLRRQMNCLQPDVIINCAAYTNVDGAEAEEALATRINGDGPGHLAAIAKELDAILVHISTDYVFPGTENFPYTEESPTGPLSAYGRSKLAGEKAIVESGLKRFIIVRTSWLYGPGGKNFVDTISRLAGERDSLRVVADQRGCPTYTGDLAQALFNLLQVAERRDLNTQYGIYHFANAGECSWYEFAEAIVAELRQQQVAVQVRKIEPIATHEYPLPATRPTYSVFNTEKYRRVTGAVIPKWQDGLKCYINERKSF